MMSSENKNTAPHSPNNKEGKKFPLDVRALALSLGVFFGVLTLILSIWSRVTGFASAFWSAFGSLHPSPFGHDTALEKIWQHAVGILVDMAYSTIDGIIMGALIAVFYNMFLPKK